MTAEPTFEQTVATLHNSYAYRVPPSVNIDSFTCETWPTEWCIFRGSMKVLTTDKECFVVLLNQDGHTEATRFPVQYRGAIPVLNQAQDSSRFFILIIKDPSGQRQAFVGIGFQDRETAFDFKVALSDFGKWLERSKNPQSVQQMPVQDFSLKGDQKIQIKLGSKAGGAAGAGKAVTSFMPSPQ